MAISDDILQKSVIDTFEDELENRDRKVTSWFYATGRLNRSQILRSFLIFGVLFILLICLDTSLQDNKLSYLNLIIDTQNTFTVIYNDFKIITFAYFKDISNFLFVNFISVLDYVIILLQFEGISINFNSDLLRIRYVNNTAYMYILYMYIVIFMPYLFIRLYQVHAQKVLTIGQLEQFYVPIYFLPAFFFRRKSQHFYVRLIVNEDRKTISTRYSKDVIKTLFNLKKSDFEVTDKIETAVDAHQIISYFYFTLSYQIFRNEKQNNYKEITKVDKKVDKKEDKKEDQKVDNKSQNNLQKVEKTEQKAEQKVDLKFEIELRDNLYKVAVQNKDKELKKALQNIMKKHNQNLSQEHELQELKKSIQAL
jgi:hypothetical protein